VKTEIMKAIFTRFMFTMILLGGLFVGILKGNDAKQKWVAKKKSKYAAKNHTPADPAWVMLDEIEMATYHS
jgi:hypothetical protein